VPNDQDVTRAIAAGREAFETVGRSDDAIRLFVLPTAIGRHHVTIVAAESLADQQELLEDARAGFLVAIPLGLLLAWLGGNALARRSLAPVASMTARAAEIGATSLHERLPVGNPRDELGRLATVFNDLLARLDAAFDQQRRFMADASHELRTPVAIMRGEADTALSQAARSPDEYRGALEVVRAVRDVASRASSLTSFFSPVLTLASSRLRDASSTWTNWSLTASVPFGRSRSPGP
jgi:signal transduction histidine kinase